jgi:hypothetical protein
VEDDYSITFDQELSRSGLNDQALLSRGSNQYRDPNLAKSLPNARKNDWIRSNKGTPRVRVRVRISNRG